MIYTQSTSKMAASETAPKLQTSMIPASAVSDILPAGTVVRVWKTHIQPSSLISGSRTERSGSGPVDQSSFSQTSVVPVTQSALTPPQIFKRSLPEYGPPDLKTFIENLTFKKIITLLKLRNIPFKGSKSELVERLYANWHPR